MSPLSCGPAGIVPMLSVGTGRAPRSRSASSVRKAAPRHGVNACCASQPAALPAARQALGRPCSNSLFCFLRRDHMPDRRTRHARGGSLAPPYDGRACSCSLLDTCCSRRPSGMRRDWCDLIRGLVSLALPLRLCRTIRQSRRGWRVWLPRFLRHCIRGRTSVGVAACYEDELCGRILKAGRQAA